MKKYRGAYIKNDREIGLMREANRHVANVLDLIEDMVKPGVSTMEFEDVARAYCDKHNLKPAFLGYHGYPYALCVSVNEVVVHGFPSTRLLQEGDIVSVDMGVVYEGFVGDAARTFAVGQISDEAKKLMKVTEDALYAGIAVAKAGTDVYMIGATVQALVEKEGFGVVRRFVGHGIGAKMHEKPEVPNFKPGMGGMPLQTGMVIAIEPMVTVGTYEVEILDDNWTAVTRDRKLAAHFEHSIAITAQGPQILSISDKGLRRITQQ